MAVDEESNKLMRLIIGAIIMILGIGAGIFFFMQQSSEPAVETEVFNETETDSAAETPTPTPDYELSDFPITVLNGSGIVGAAGDMQDVLEDAGFTVDDVGNAGSYDYTETVIQAKESVPEAFIEELQDALSGNYDVEIGDELDDDADTDVTVIVGSNGDEAEDTTEDQEEEASDDEVSTDSADTDSTDSEDQSTEE